MEKFIFSLMFVLLMFKGFSTELVIYEAPSGAIAAPEFELEVNGEKVFVYNARTAAIAYFSFSGTVDVKVTFLSPVYNYDIRPKSREIASEQIRNHINFKLDKPENLSIEINKNIKRPLFLFANPLETDIPDRNDKNVIFFETGKIHYPGEVFIKSDQTVYIEGGAIVRGHFMTSQGKNIKILGRGILDNSHYLKGQHRPIEINQCENVLIDGIIITEAKHWTATSFSSKNVTYNNLKIVSDNDWDDGIDIVGSQNVLVNNCFIRTKDDCIAIKAGITYFTDFFTGNNVDSIIIQNSVMWNAVWGNALEIGFETRADTMQNIIFRNIDILHVEAGGTFTIHNGDRGLIRNVLYENIIVENPKGWLIDFRILESRYSKDPERGRIENIHFRNIFVESDDINQFIQMKGYSESNDIQNVTLENFYINGIKITQTNASDFQIRTRFSEDPVFF